MFYKFEITGCLTALIILTFIVFLMTKLWWLVAIMVLIWMVNTFITVFLQKLEQKKAEKEKFNPEIGQSYKVCPNCGEKVKVTDLKCPYCGQELG
ncbi:zinc ribbon domain-containing protein [bacterium]|nr:zinc ribbon domain-containing protein [bacterium]